MYIYIYIFFLAFSSDKNVFHPDITVLVDSTKNQFPSFLDGFSLLVERWLLTVDMVLKFTQKRES